MSSEKEILSILKEVKHTTTEKTKKTIGFVWYDIIGARFLAILVFMYLVFIEGAIISNGITSLMDLLEKFFSIVISNKLAELIIVILTIDIYLLILVTVFLDEETRKKRINDIYKITLIALFLSFVWIQFVYDNQDKSGGELLGEALEQSGENSESVWTNIKCSTYGKLIRDETCIVLENTEQAEVESTIRISSISEENLRNTIRLDSLEDGIEILYEIRAKENTEITLERIQCFIDENKDILFYEKNISEIVSGGETFDFNCENLGQKMNKENQTLDILTKLEYSVLQQFKYEVPVINCETQEIQNLMLVENKVCDKLSKNTLKNSIQTTVDLDSDDAIITSDGVSINVLSFKNDLPIYIGDSKTEERDFLLFFKKNKDLGNVKNFEFVSNQIFPKSLSYEGTPFTQSHANQFIENDEELELRIKFGENDNALDANPNAINLETIEFTAKVTFIKTINSNYQNILFIKDYDIPTSTIN